MSSLVERLQLVVDATTSAAETRFTRLTAVARETGETSVRSASNVSAAAERVAAAQLKAADEAGKLGVAETRLQELRDSGTAKGSQLAAAEEKVASAQRRLHQASREVAAATEAQTAAQREAEEQAGQTGEAQQELGDQTADLQERIRGLVAGAALGAWLRGATTDFLTGARAAASLGMSMNATVEQAGRLSQMLAAIGLEEGDILEIQASFAQVVGANQDALREMGAELKSNEDGTTNWALTLEDALIQLQKMPDATKRNQTGFMLFGEEGYKQLSRLLTSGTSVKDALEAIGTPFSDEDVAATREYDAAMMRLQMTAGNLGRSVGRELVPILAGLLEGFGDVATVVTAIPLPIAAATAAAIALGVTGFTPAAAAGARLSVALAVIRTEVGLVSGAMVAGGAAAGVLGAGLSAAGAASGRLGGMLAGALGGPLGIGLIAAGTAFYFAKGGADALEESTRQAAGELEVASQGNERATKTSAQLGRQLDEEAGYWERVAALRAKAAEEDGAGDLGGDFLGFGALLGGLDEGSVSADAFADKIDLAREELGEFGAQQLAVELTAKSLNDLIAEGTTSGEEYAVAVRAAADSQARQAETAGLADAAVAALRATTDLAYLSQLNLINAELGARDASNAFLDAMDAANAAVDDQATSVDEVRQALDRVQTAALGAADAAADAAVAAATANGTVLTELAEAQIRADAVISDLQARLNTPGLGDQARTEIQGIIDRLATAKENGTIEATLQTLGVGEATAELDQATEDRDTVVRVESRGGPAVDEYLTRLTTRDRLAIVRVESRGGPAVDAYLDGLAGQDRLAIIRVETRGGPAVDAYLDGLANQDRTAVISVQRTGGAAPPSPAGVPALFGAPAVAGGYGAGAVNVERLVVNVQADGTGRVTQHALAEAGRQVARQLSAYDRLNGTRRGAVTR